MLFAIPSISAQSQLNTAGHSFSSTTGSASISVGQLLYPSLSDASYTLTPSLQQGINPTVTAQKTTHHNATSIHPNPAQEEVVLQVSEFDNTTIYYLYDLTGYCLQSGRIDNTTTNIKIQHLSPALYYITIRNNSGILGHHKLLIQ